VDEKDKIVMKRIENLNARRNKIDKRNKKFEENYLSNLISVTRI